MYQRQTGKTQGKVGVRIKFVESGTGHSLFIVTFCRSQGVFSELSLPELPILERGFFGKVI
jgi:hypothetical protein